MKVIYLKSELKSFSWNDGLFAIEKEVDGVLHLWKIGEDGRLKKYRNGQPDICCTGVNNKGIHETDLMTIAAPSLYEENIKLRQQVEVLRAYINKVEINLRNGGHDDNSWAGKLYLEAVAALKQTEQ